MASLGEGVTSCHVDVARQLRPHVTRALETSHAWLALTAGPPCHPRGGTALRPGGPVERSVRGILSPRCRRVSQEEVKRWAESLENLISHECKSAPCPRGGRGPWGGAGCHPSPTPLPGTPRLPQGPWATPPLATQKRVARFPARSALAAPSQTLGVRCLQRHLRNKPPPREGRPGSGRTGAQETPDMVKGHVPKEPHKRTGDAESWEAAWFLGPVGLV